MLKLLIIVTIVDYNMTIMDRRLIRKIYVNI